MVSKPTIQIEKTSDFNQKLLSILRYIANDSPANALKFKQELDRKIQSLSHMPYKYRKSHYHADSSIRDLIHKGYAIPYLVDRHKIVILEIFKWVDR